MTSLAYLLALSVVLTLACVVLLYASIEWFAEAMREGRHPIVGLAFVSLAVVATAGAFLWMYIGVQVYSLL